MRTNIGTADRIFRVVVALVFAALYFGHIVTGAIGIGLMALAVIFALTSLVSFCPIYFALGLKTTGKAG